MRSFAANSIPPRSRSFVPPFVVHASACPAQTGMSAPHAIFQPLESLFNHSLTARFSHLPIWRWQGTLHCHEPGSSRRLGTTNRTLGAPDVPFIRGLPGCLCSMNKYLSGSITPRRDKFLCRQISTSILYLNRSLRSLLPSEIICAALRLVFLTSFIAQTPIHQQRNRGNFNR